MFIPDYKIVHDKMILLYKTQVFFNFSLYEAERMNTVFLEKIPELDTWESYVNNRESKCLQSAKNIIYMLYLVFRYLIIFSIYGIALLFMAMNWIDVGFQAIIYGFCCIVLLYIVMFPDIFGTFVLTRFYQIYFFLLNKHSDLFSWEVQMRDYFLDMYV
jgi:hypothetical protein